MRPLQLSTVIGFCALAAACSGLPPTAPSTTVAGGIGDLGASRGVGRTGIQRVEEGSGGGGGECFIRPTITCVELRLKTVSTTFRSAAMSPYDPSTPLSNFSVTASFDEVPGEINATPVGIVVGRFTGGTIDLDVVNGTATVAVTLTGPFDGDRTFSASGQAPAVQSQAGCNGTFVRVTTTLTVQLQYLGRTEIVALRDALCTS